MTKDELITKQQLEIEGLKEEVERYRTAYKKVGSIIYCIGGPLNDNYLQYSRKQMQPFFEISQALGL